VAGPNIDAMQSREIPTSEARWLIAGHPSANPDDVAALFQGNYQSYEITTTDHQLEHVLIGIDACALVVNAKTGVSPAMIEFWNHISERQFPRLLIVNGLELSEIDFDDIVMIANRVLEPVVTPFLVLHDELGEPIGLISLATNQVHDYSAMTIKEYPADDELLNLITDFRTEYLEQIEGLDEDSFRAGLLVPAIPLVQFRGIGRSELNYYFEQITKL